MLKKLFKFSVIFISFTTICMIIYSTHSRNTETVFTNKRIESVFNKKDIQEVKTRLSIPAIRFNRYLYPLGDERNDLEKNIIFVSSSDMPDKKTGNVIIAGHNGNSAVSFFRYLHLLKVGDEIFIHHEGIKYEYVIVSRYLVPKIGTVPIRRDRTKDTVTLITCYGEDEQLIFIATKK